MTAGPDLGAPATAEPAPPASAVGGTSLASAAARGAAWSGMATIVLRLGGLVVGITLARLLTPDQFGIYAVALTVQSILIAVADLGLSADIVRSDDPDRVAPTVATLGLVSGTTLAIACAATSGALARSLGSPEAAPAIAVLAITLALAGSSVVPYGMLQRRFQQRELFLVGVADFVVSTVVTLVLVWMGLGVLGLACGRVAAQVVSSTLQFVLARVRPRYGVDRTVVRPVLAFGLPIAAANLLSWALLNTDNVVLVRVAGATALGFYVLAFNVSSWPMSALSQVVRSISMPYFSRSGDGIAGLASIAAVAWAGALPAGAVLAVLAGSVIDVLYGAKWLPAAPVLAALGLYGSLRVLFDIFAGFLYSQGRSRPVLWIQLGSLVLLVGAMIAATSAYGIIGAGWAHVVVAFGVVLPAYLVVLRRSGLPLRQLGTALAWPTVAAVPAAGAAVLVRSVLDQPLAALLVGSFAAVLVYGAFMARWFQRRLVEIRSATQQPVEVLP